MTARAAASGTAPASSKKSALMNQLRNKAVEQKTLSSPLRMARRREVEKTAAVSAAQPLIDRLAPAALLCSLAFLFWLFNRPYQGIWHDARVYGLVAAHWIYPDALASDLFFRFGSQGSFSLFTPLYGELVRALGLDFASRAVVLAGGLAWTLALFALSRALLGDTVAGRFALLFGVMLSVSYSPNGGIFVLNENFATARILAMPCGLLAVALLAAGRRYWELALGLALLSCLLHPLLGLWPLALIVLSRLSWRWALALVCLPSLALAAVGMLDLNIPYLRLMRGDWLAYMHGRLDVLLAPWGENCLPVYFTAMAGLLAGARAGQPALRPLYARMLLLALGGLALLSLASSVWPVEIVVQGQAARVFWLALPLAAAAVLDVAQRAFDGRQLGWLLATALALLAMDDAWLTPLVWLICALCFVPPAWLEACLRAWAQRASAWHKPLWLAALALWLMALPGFIVTLETVGSRFVVPWWSGAPALQGLLAGSAWPLPLAVALGWRGLAPRLTPTLAVVGCVLIGGLLAVVLQGWDKRPSAMRQEEARYLAPGTWRHPFVAFVKPGDTVAWPEHEPTVWFELHTASYWGKTQGIGVVFSQAKFAEWQRRRAVVEQATMPLAVCADPLVDWVVTAKSVADFSPVAVWDRTALYDCRAFHLRRLQPASGEGNDVVALLD